jgi:hypothetical protein
MEAAEWPDQPVPEAVKRILKRFYKLIDSPRRDASDRLANDVFTEDGTFVVNKRSIVGREGKHSNTISTGS